MSDQHERRSSSVKLKSPGPTPISTPITARNERKQIRFKRRAHKRHLPATSAVTRVHRDFQSVDWLVFEKECRGLCSKAVRHWTAKKPLFWDVPCVEVHPSYKPVARVKIAVKLSVCLANGSKG
jgi:hypothetical protein